MMRRNSVLADIAKQEIQKARKKVRLDRKEFESNLPKPNVMQLIYS